MRVEPRSRRVERKRILALRRRLILAAAALAAFSSVLPWGWTASIHDGDGQVILLLAAVGAFAALRYREHRVGLALVGEAVLGAIVACTAVVHLAWGERGPGLALLLIAGPLWFTAAALPGRCVRWVEAGLAGGDGTGHAWAGSSSSKRCPDCYQRIRLSARICRFCGFRFEAGFEWIEIPPLSASRRSQPRSRRELAARPFGYIDDGLGRTIER